jgi:hypothetical protein
MKKYYLHNGNEQQGPFDLNELKAKGITKDTHIWKEGFPDWTLAGKIDELKELFTTATPPPLNAIPKAPPMPPKTIMQQEPKKKSILAKVLIIAAIVVLALIGLFVYNLLQQQLIQQQEQAKTRSEQAAKDRVKANINAYVVCGRSAYQFSELGGIYNLSITVTNNTDYSMDKVRVKVDYIKTDRGIWKSEFINFTNLNPHTQQTLRAPDSERGTSVDQNITSISSSALGL